MKLFPDLAAWLPVTSGLAQLKLSEEGTALRLDYDFGSGGGFVVVRREVDLQLPERFRFKLRLRGSGQPNGFELKLVDRSNLNVWWYKRAVLEWPERSTEWLIDSHEVTFAWGPAGGGQPSQIAALELALVAGSGGVGQVWLEALEWEDLSVLEQQTMSAYDPRTGVRDLVLPGDWSTKSDEAWLQIEWRTERLFSALQIDWVAGHAPKRFELFALSGDEPWRVCYTTTFGGASQSFIYLGPTRARALRLQGLRGPHHKAVGVRNITVVPVERACSLTDFFHSVAAQLPAGRLPRYFSRQQSYWTVIGAPACPTQALINEQGMIEVQRPGFSLDPLLLLEDVLLDDVLLEDGLTSPTSAQSLVGLLDDSLPMPTVTHTTPNYRWLIKAAAIQVQGQWGVLIRYQIDNRSPRWLCGIIGALLRPFQVTPPWQSYKEFGGVFPLHELARQQSVVRVNRRWAVKPLTSLSRLRMLRWSESIEPERSVSKCAADGDSLHDPDGLAQGVIEWALQLAPGASAEFCLFVPFAGFERNANLDWLNRLELADAQAAYEQTRQHWQLTLNQVELSGPAEVTLIAQVLRTATAHILVNRQGAALQPGPRRYARSWIRDGATMAAALLRMGLVEPVADYLRWYAPFIQADGYVPCCVDDPDLGGAGADPLVEHDSHGQWLHVVADYYRFTGDRALLLELQGSVGRVVDYLCALRATRCQNDELTAAQPAIHGLIPESVSHEGYMAQPVHSYWDSFWAWHGLLDAGDLFTELGDSALAQRCLADAEQLGLAISASIRWLIHEREIPFVPGSVEWADCDPTATAVAVAQLEASALLPSETLRYTFEHFIERRRALIVEGHATEKYSAYEIRVVSALLALRMRNEAHELLRFYLSEMRPHAWHQWPEITWPDPLSPGHLGDLPHSWIGAEAVLAIRNLLVMEVGRGLVLGRGIVSAWLPSPGLHGAHWPTPFGALSFTIVQPESQRIDVELTGAVAPPEGILLDLPGLSSYPQLQVSSGDVSLRPDGQILIRCAPAMFSILNS